MIALRLCRINPLSSKLSMRKKEKCVLCMVFIVFMTICVGALFFVPDLRDTYLSNYVSVWSPPTLSTVGGVDGYNPEKEMPAQLPRPSEASGKQCDVICNFAGHRYINPNLFSS